MRIDFNKLKKFTKLSGLDFTSNYSLYTGKDYITKNDKLSTKKLFYHFVSDKTAICLPRYLHSKIYIIDIDKRNNLRPLPDIIRDLARLLGNPFYLEKGLSGGYHLYFNYNDYLSINFWRWFTVWFKKNHNAEIEPIYGDKKIKIPFSVSYKIAGKYNYLCRDQIGEKINSFDDLLKIFSSIEINPIPKIYVDNINDIEPEATKLKAFRVINKESNVNFGYGCGTRHKTQLALGFYILKYGGNYYDFERECHYWNNGTSKDMALPYDQKMRIIKGIWNYCSNKFDKIVTKRKEFITNSKPDELIIDDNYKLRKSEEAALEQIVKFYYPLYNDKYKKGGKLEKRIIKEIKIILKVMNEIKEYREKHKYRYKIDLISYLNKGIPLGLELQKKIADHYDIKNIEEKINFLESVGLIQVIKDENGFSYSYKKLRYVKHFFIRSIKKILKKIIGKIKEKFPVYKENLIEFNFVYKGLSGYG